MESSSGLIEYETNPSPLWVIESFTNKNPNSAFSGGKPVFGSFDSKIQKASFLVMSRPATTSTTIPNESATSNLPT